MPSGYPAVIDNFTNPTGVDNLSDAPVLHHSQHANVNDAVKAIETELGVLPKGSAASVADRLTAIETAASGFQVASEKGQPSGYASLDVGGLLAQNIDAAKIASGTVPIARIPNLSGAKILGTGSGGAAIPLDAVPNLPASQTTSGTFSASRIPSLDGSIIGSGTISAARLPSSVTANANARVVADQAGRDAIPVIERTDGLMVLQLSPFVLWAYRVDNSTWVQVGGAGWKDYPPVTNNDQTDYINLTNTGFSPGTTMGVAFKAPPSGMIYVTVSGHLTHNNSGGYAYLSFEVKSGATIGAGTVIQGGITDFGIGIGAGSSSDRLSSSRRKLISGLTPGNDYNAWTVHLMSGGTNYSIFSREILVEPVL